MANTPPLKISDLSHPNSTNILNKWADSQAQIVSDQAAQIKTLQDQVDKLSKPSSSASTPSSSSSSSTSGDYSDQTSSRTFGSEYSTTKRILVCGWGTVSGGSGDSTIAAYVGSAGATTQIWADTIESTIAGKPAGFLFVVPANKSYKVVVTGIISSTPGKWWEIPL